MKEKNQIKEILEFPVIPITENTFERQGWEKYTDEDGADGSEYYYYMMPLPKDNPDTQAPVLISSTNDEWEDFDNLKKGEYIIEIDGLNGLGLCWTEEELEVSYKRLTNLDIE